MDHQRPDRRDAHTQALGAQRQALETLTHLKKIPTYCAVGMVQGVVMAGPGPRDHVQLDSLERWVRYDDVLEVIDILKTQGVLS